MEAADLLLLAGEIFAGFLEQLFQGLTLLLELDGAGRRAAQLDLAFAEGPQLGLERLSFLLEIGDLLRLGAFGRLDGTTSSNPASASERASPASPVLS